jgi:GNAT superfamily N-acetyltransferase
MVIRRATAEDVPAIVTLLADDHLGATRETPDDLTPYTRAFALIDADPSEYLAVAELDGEAVGTLQLSFIPGLSRRGAQRARIEAVRIAAPYRGRGFGETLVRWAIDTARGRGCALIQLTSDKARPDAHRFYRRLGFTASHEGDNLPLT